MNREQPTLVGVVNREQEKFHKRHLRGRGMLECVCVYVQGFIQDFEFWYGGGGGTPKFGVDVEGVYST